MTSHVINQFIFQNLLFIGYESDEQFDASSTGCSHLQRSTKRNDESVYLMPYILYIRVGLNSESGTSFHTWEYSRLHRWNIKLKSDIDLINYFLLYFFAAKYSSLKIQKWKETVKKAIHTGINLFTATMLSQCLQFSSYSFKDFKMVNLIRISFTVGEHRSNKFD